jgi:hypothetical protein
VIDVTHFRASDAEKGSGLVMDYGSVRLRGHRSEDLGATLTFEALEPTKMVRWMAAEVVGEFAHDSVRVRLVDGDGVVRWMDPDDNLLIKVVDVDDWDSQWTEPSLLSNLDLWTYGAVGFHVRLVRTDFDRDPRVEGVRVLADYPTWEGSVHHTIQAIVEAVSSVRVLVVVRETVTSDTSVWRIGAPWSEHNIELAELVQVTVDGAHKSASLASGVVTLAGPPARAGSAVEIAVKFLPNGVVRRTDHVTTVDKVPCWWMQDLVTAGGLSGSSPRIPVGAYEVVTRRVDVRVSVNGIASRHADALQMRAALQAAFPEGLAVTMPSCRVVTVTLDGLVEVVNRGAVNLPMASGVLECALTEHVYPLLVRRPRDDDNQPLYTAVSTEIVGSGVSAEPTVDTIGDIC